MQPTYRTASGRLFQADCLEVLAELEDESVDLVFADPPFNLGKVYGAGGAAERLGLRPTTLASRMKALGVRAEDARGG